MPHFKALDTHVHADHLTGLAELRDRTRCITVMGEQSGVDVVSMRVADGEKIGMEGIGLDTIHTPGHTRDSYSFLMGDRVFTGDTLLIHGTGRTDFQNGNPVDHYRSIFNRLLKLPDETLVYPAHDYKRHALMGSIGAATAVVQAAWEASVSLRAKEKRRATMQCIVAPLASPTNSGESELMQKAGRRAEHESIRRRSTRSGGRGCALLSTTSARAVPVATS